MLSYNEFNVSTEVLRNEELLAKNPLEAYGKFQILGDRGERSQSGASFYDKKSKVLFYGLLQLNAIACWRTTNRNYTMTSQGRVFMNDELMVFPSDLKVDQDDTLWVISNMLPAFMYSKINPHEYNFRIFNQTVADAIKGTTCDSKIVVNKSVVETISRSNMGTDTNTASRQFEFCTYIFLVVCAIIFM